MNISLAEIINDRYLIRRTWVDNFTKHIDIIEYTACNEGYGGLYLGIGQKDVFPNFLSAFLTIWLKMLYFHEEWKDLTISNQDADLVIENWFIPEASKWKLSDLSSSALKSEFQRRTGSIKQGIKEKKGNSYDVDFLPGIYIHDVAIENYQEFEPPIILDTYKSGISIEEKWNQVTYFVETVSGFVFYDWGTSA
jgi:hypothetical protein